MEKGALKFKPKKHLGQVFLRSDKVAQRMVDALDIKRGEDVLEIGAGNGIITKRLVPLAKRIYAVEIDPRLIERLKDMTKEFKNIEIIDGDILKIDLSLFQKLKIIGNIPYSLTTPLLFKLFKYKKVWEKTVLILQKEFADRILAPPNTKKYGSITVAVRFYTETKRLFSLSPSLFWPCPKVSSSSLLFIKRENPPFEIVDVNFFLKTVRASFSQRRKFLANALKSSLNLNQSQLKEVQDKTGVDLRRRAETLTIEEFGELANTIYSIIQPG